MVWGRMKTHSQSKAKYTNEILTKQCNNDGTLSENDNDDNDDGDDYVLVNDDVLKQTFANVLNKLFDGAQPSEMSKFSPHCMIT